MTAYCDTSFFLRQLVPENDRGRAMQTAVELERRLGFVPITSFTRFEVIQALRFEAWRYRNDRRKGLPPDQVEAALNLFLAEIGSSFQIIPIIWETVFAQAELFTRTTPEKGWRTVDLVHVASATSVQATEFFSFDQQQNHLAGQQRLKTLLPKSAA
ncbi:MAG: type II toxin-antitoxin system VapC family toxin [Verrucomicrobiales bacterium]|nr:type II toxin-antitoxin system VapC family toxin [Verrucomicrobiales bacterium]